MEALTTDVYMQTPDGERWVQWRDTVVIPAYGEVRIRIRFDYEPGFNLNGKTVFHVRLRCGLSAFFRGGASGGPACRQDGAALFSPLRKIYRPPPTVSLPAARGHWHDHVLAHA